MPADRRIDTAGRARLLGNQPLVQRLAHAVQALEFVTLDTARLLDHARDSERVVRGELRIEIRPRGEQLAHARHVAKVGHRLAGEHRIVGKTALLRALHLGVPVGALDEPHHQPPVERARRIRHPVDHLRSALLVGLDREPEAVPARERRIGQHRADHVEREFEPVGLLGINREIQIERLRLARQLHHTRRELPQHALARDRLVARMQRRKLHRNTRTVRQFRVAGGQADRVDRARVALEVALRVGLRARALAKHVVGVAEFAVRGGAAERFFDALSEHEMRAEQPHRLSRRGAHRWQPQAFA